MVRWLTLGGFRRAKPLLASAACFAALPVNAQVPMGSSEAPARIFSSDMAMLETQDPRKDINCTVTPAKTATLGFDLRFHGGFDVTVPLKELAGMENQLTILFRVTPQDPQGSALSTSCSTFTGPLARGRRQGRGDAFTARVDLGEGTYHVDWLMRDRSERVCSFYWDVGRDACGQRQADRIGPRRPARSKRRCEPSSSSMSRPVERAHGFASAEHQGAGEFRAADCGCGDACSRCDTVALVSILRRISREPQFGKFSVVAFNIQEQRVIYRQQSADKIDFPALGDAINSVKLGPRRSEATSAEARRHRIPDRSDPKEMSTDDHPDAVVFAGPKIMLDEVVPQDNSEAVRSDIDYPVFYMNYTLNPHDDPWKDSISRAVKLFQGNRVHHQPSSRPVVRGYRDGFAYSKIQTQPDCGKWGAAVASVS